MRTDEHLFLVFNEHPDWVYGLLSEMPPEECHKASEALNLQLTGDSVFRSIQN